MQWKIGEVVGHTFQSCEGVTHRHKGRSTEVMQQRVEVKKLSEDLVQARTEVYCCELPYPKGQGSSPLSSLGFLTVWPCKPSDGIACSGKELQSYGLIAWPAKPESLYFHGQGFVMAVKLVWGLGHRSPPGRYSVSGCRFAGSSSNHPSMKHPMQLHAQQFPLLHQRSPVQH